MADGRIHSIESFGTLDGPGVRFIVFMQGCPLRCCYCHNPDSQSFAGAPVRSAADMMTEIVRYRNFIRRGGVTLSGGEPLAQADFAVELLGMCRAENLHTAIDTSGIMPPEGAVREAIDAADMLLLDIKALDAAECVELTGADNTNALATLDYCESCGKEVWIRHVLVPGFTSDPGKVARLTDFLKKYRCVKKVELLPFHQLGRYKYEAADRPYRLRNTPELSSAELQCARRILQERGVWN